MFRYLATGESQKSLSIAYKCSPASVHNIVCEATKAITAVLKGKVFPKLSAEYLKTVAAGFENRWNFPHCIGAIDGKHITIQVRTIFLKTIGYTSKFCVGTIQIWI